MSKESAKLLLDFINRKKITRLQFCAITDVARTSFFTYLEGGPISKKLAKRISKALLMHFREDIPEEKLY